MSGIVQLVHELTSRYLDGMAMEQDVRELEELVRNHEVARVAFLNEAHLHDVLGLLVEPSEATLSDAPGPTWPRLVFRRALPLAAAAALMAAVGYYALTFYPGVRSGSTVVRTATTDVVFRRGRALMSFAPGMRLRSGDWVETGEKGNVTLAYGDSESTVTLNAGSCFELQKDEEGEKGYLERGGLTAQISQRAKTSPVRMLTPQARIKVLGTRFDLKSGTGSTRLDVKEGRVSLTGQKEDPELVVPSGFYSVATPWAMPVALPESILPASFFTVRKEFSPGKTIFLDDFEGTMEPWYTYDASGRTVGRIAGVASVRLLEAERDGKRGQVLAMDGAEVGGEKYALARALPFPLRSFSLEGDIRTVGGSAHGGALPAIFSRISMPEGARGEMVYMSPSSVGDMVANKRGWTRFRIEHFLFDGQSGTQVMDMRSYLDGRLVHWIRVAGGWKDFVSQLYLVTGDAQLQLDNVEARELVRHRAGDDIIALYRFNEGQGKTVRNGTDKGSALDLDIGNPEFIEWVDGGLKVTGRAEIRTRASRELLEAWKKSGGLTFEFWMIVDGKKRTDRKYAVMDIASSKGWFNYVQTYDAESVPRRLAHFVFTLERQGKDVVMTIYRAGDRERTVPMAGLDQLLGSVPFSLCLPGASARNMAEDTVPWTGELHYAAVHGHILSHEEIMRSWRKGPPGHYDDVAYGAFLLKDDFQGKASNWRAEFGDWRIVVLPDGNRVLEGKHVPGQEVHRVYLDVPEHPEAFDLELEVFMDPLGGGGKRFNFDVVPNVPVKKTMTNPLLMEPKKWYRFRYSFSGDHIACSVSDGLGKERPQWVGTVSAPYGRIYCYLGHPQHTTEYRMLVDNISVSARK